MKFEIKTVAQVARILASLSNKRPYGTLATVDMQGIARARTVVLRHFDAEAFTVRLSTHHHAGKVVQLRKNPEAELTLWLDEQKVQLRLLTEWRVVDARRETSPDLRQAAWLEHSPGSRQTFYWPDPGQRLSPRARPPAQQDPLPETPPASFALLIGTVVEMDCLQIMQPVHVRYLHTRERSRWSTQRITP